MYSRSWPRSLGCVKLPLAAAARAWPCLTYGSLVTSGPLVVSGVYTFRPRRVKIGNVCPLACGAFGV